MSDWREMLKLDSEANRRFSEAVRGLCRAIEENQNREKEGMERWRTNWQKIVDEKEVKLAQKTCQ